MKPRLRPLSWYAAMSVMAFWGLSNTSSVAAHDARPLSIAIAEATAGVYRIVVRAPPTIDARNAPRIAWPEACEVRESGRLAFAVGSTSMIACTGGLEGESIRVEYPSYNPAITTLFRYQPVEGGAITAVLPPDELRWTVPAAPGRGAVALDYSVLGFEHIWEGPDHLLFVAGLLLLARRPRRVLLAVTGFTAAHSLTLSLAALGFVNVPIGPVETMIALSILFLAVELARGEPKSFSRRFPVSLAFVFGLLHGFGFASALGEIGLPTNELATGLLFFNVGVELGQLVFIAAAGVALFAWARCSRRAITDPFGLEPVDVPARIGAYVLGVPAAFWFFERAAATFVS